MLEVESDFVDSIDLVDKDSEINQDSSNQKDAEVNANKRAALLEEWTKAIGPIRNEIETLQDEDKNRSWLSGCKKELVVMVDEMKSSFLAHKLPLNKIAEALVKTVWDSVFAPIREDLQDDALLTGEVGVLQRNELLVKIESLEAKYLSDPRKRAPITVVKLLRIAKSLTKWVWDFVIGPVRMDIQLSTLPEEDVNKLLDRIDTMRPLYFAGPQSYSLRNFVKELRVRLNDHVQAMDATQK